MYPQMAGNFLNRNCTTALCKSNEVVIPALLKDASSQRDANSSRDPSLTAAEVLEIIASNAKNIGNYPYDINKAYGKKRARKHPWRPDRRQNYPETTQKLPRNKILILHLSRKELSISCYFIHMQDVKKSHLTWVHCQKMG